MEVIGRYNFSSSQEVQLLWAPRTDGSAGWSVMHRGGFRSRSGLISERQTSHPSKESVTHGASPTLMGAQHLPGHWWNLSCSWYKAWHANARTGQRLVHSGSVAETDEISVATSWYIFLQLLAAPVGLEETVTPFAEERRVDEDRRRGRKSLSLNTKCEALKWEPYFQEPAAVSVSYLKVLMISQVGFLSRKHGVLLRFPIPGLTFIFKCLLDFMRSQRGQHQCNTSKCMQCDIAMLKSGWT